MNDTSAPLWRLPPDSEFNWTQCGDEHIVFHPASGETHYLNDLSALTLRFLEAEPATIADLSSRITDFLGTDTSKDMEQQLDCLLARFDQLGVAEQMVTGVNTQ